MLSYAETRFNQDGITEANKYTHRVFVLKQYKYGFRLVCIYTDYMVSWMRWLRADEKG
jgi:hypothetical protein